MRFHLDTPVEKRKIGQRDTISFDLDFPPVFATAGYKDWQARAGWSLAADKPGRMPGAVRIALTFEEKTGRRDLDALIKPVLDLCVRHRVIDGDHRTILRGVTASWGTVHGVRVVIEPAVTVTRIR